MKDVQQDVVASEEEKKWFSGQRAMDPADLFNLGSEEEEEEEEEEEGGAGERNSGEVSLEKSKQAKNVKYFFKNDHVRIISGELKNLDGIIEEADLNRHQVHIRVSVGDDFETLVLNESEVVKVFKMGDHVKVLDGMYAGETGTVLIADDGTTGSCVVLSDSGDREMKVFVNYLTLSVEISQGLTSVEGFNLYDLVSVS